MSEGLAVGYRWYDAQKKDPAYEFGYGLSYTTFAYSNLAVNPDLSVAFDLANTGERRASKSRSCISSFRRRPASLRSGWRAGLAWSWRRASGVACASQRIPTLFAVWDTGAGEWQRPSGRYRVHVGASSRILPLAQEIEVAR